MNDMKLIYFEGCPNSEQAREVLLTFQCDFDVIKQDDLKEGDPYLQYSSPTILNGGEIIFGQKIDPNSSACSAEKIDEKLIKQKFLISRDKTAKKGLFASIGSFGAALTVGLCPVCIPAIGAFLSSIGLGFLTTEIVLKPVLFVFLFFALFGFLWSFLKEHRHIGPLLVGIIMGVTLYIGRYIYIGATLNLVLMYGGMAGIIGVSIWNIYLRKKMQSCFICRST